MPESVLFHTQTLSIIGDILRIALPKSQGEGASSGDLAEVRHEDGVPRIAQVIKLDDEVASLQVFSGAKGLSTRARVRFLGMLAKNMIFLGHADAAGIVLGAAVPIVLTSRADSVRTRMASTAIGALYAHHLTEQRVRAHRESR